MADHVAAALAAVRKEQALQHEQFDDQKNDSDREWLMHLSWRLGELARAGAIRRRTNEGQMKKCPTPYGEGPYRPEEWKEKAIELAATVMTMLEWDFYWDEQATWHRKGGLLQEKLRAEREAKRKRP